jgi:triosephosphate isomerase (TIM)
MGRATIIAGNWKMYKTIPEAIDFVKKLAPRVAGRQAKVYLAVPFTAIHPAVEAAEKSGLVIGAQNMNDAEEGAFTGEIAARMLLDVGARFTLLGHSERRHIFGEGDDLINRKVHRALTDGLQPILCIGETLEQRHAGEAKAVIERQILDGLRRVKGKRKLAELILAYEPVWAIGTGETATPEMAQEMHDHCRKVVAKEWGEEVAEELSILYGGSAKPENAAQLLKEPDIDGLLVGGASLHPDQFIKIIEAVE